MSSSASRAWMTSGRPLSRAAAICVRNTLRLHVARAVVVVVVEPGLADRDAARMTRQRDDLGCRHVRLLGGVVGMGADGAEHARRAPRPGRDSVSDRATWVEIVTIRPTPAAFAAASTSGRRLGKLREIQVAMAVDQHDGFARRHRPLKPIGTPAVYPASALRRTLSAAAPRSRPARLPAPPSSSGCAGAGSAAPSRGAGGRRARRTRSAGSAAR